MSAARDAILRRIRGATADVRDLPVAVPRDYVGAGRDPRDAAVLVDVFEDRLRDYRAGVTRTTVGDARAAVEAVLAAHAAQRVVVPDGFPDAYLPAGVMVVRDTPPLPAARLDALDGVITTCAVAVAETGTIVLDAGPGQGRRALTLVPDLHVVLVRAEQVVAGVPDALTRLDPSRPLTWVSGPSATSDIELDRVEGVHGPRRLHVLLLP